MVVSKSHILQNTFVGQPQGSVMKTLNMFRRLDDVSVSHKQSLLCPLLMSSAAMTLADSFSPGCKFSL